MLTVGLIACTKKKLAASGEVPARTLYSASALFRAALAYCERAYDQVFVLSARYGLVELDQPLRTYDESLATAPALVRRVWAVRVYDEIKRRDLLDAHFSFHAGVNYREPLIRSLMHTDVPLAGLGIGQQLSWYKRTANQ